MTRSTLVTGNREQASGASLKVVEFISIAFPGATGTIRANTAARDFHWGGYKWSARWIIQQLPQVTEKPDLKPYRAEFSFSGLDETLVDAIFDETYSYAEVGFWRGFCDENWKLVAAPQEIGPCVYLSNAVLKLDAQAGIITFSAEGPEIFWQKDAAQLATPESQRLRYSTDTGMDRVLDQNTRVLEWGGTYERNVRDIDESPTGRYIP